MPALKETEGRKTETKRGERERKGKRMGESELEAEGSLRLGFVLSK